VRVYPADDESGVRWALAKAAGADVIVKVSGVGVFDELLEEAVLEHATPRTRVVFWDVDAPATRSRLNDDPADPFHALVGRYDLVPTYGGGQPVVEAYEAVGARRCVPIYNALDRTRTTRLRMSRASPRTCLPWATACRTVRRAWKSPSSAQRSACRTGGSSSVAAAGATR
jgi:hypothetical protein